MDHIRQIEVLFSILLAMFDTQINTLYVLDGHQMRSEIVRRTKKLALVLLSSIEDIERELNEKIEEEAEQMLGHSATLVNVIAEVKREMPEMEILKKLYGMVKNGHTTYTTSLDDEELHMKEAVAERFNMMKRRAGAILSQIEKM